MYKKINIQAYMRNLNVNDNSGSRPTNINET